MSQPSNEHIEDVLAQDGVWVSTTVGISMWPMLRNRRDTIVVRPCKSQLQKYDVALYRRGDAYVLHRVIGVKESNYRILGDNCRDNSMRDTHTIQPLSNCKANKTLE